MPVYVLDSNFFIQAHRSHYPIDIAIGFWKKVQQLAEEGKIISIDKVKNELYHKNDALEEWCKNHLPEDFFKDTSTVMAPYSEVIAWATSKRDHYLPNALNEFLDADEADAFLIAFCLDDQANKIVVTHEKSQPKRKSKIKIPDACDELHVSYVNTIEMFRELREQF